MSFIQYQTQDGSKTASENLLCPFIQIRIENIARRIEGNARLLIDTGASRSALPKTLFQSLLIPPAKSKIFHDYNRNAFVHQIYIINLMIFDRLFNDVEIIGTVNPRYGLLGRDLLSHYFLRCDGPNQRFELDFIK